MTREQLEEKIDQAEEIYEEMLERVGEIQEVFRGTEDYDRAKAYFLAQLQMAMNDDHMYLGGGSYTFENGIESLRRQLEEFDSEESDSENG